YEGWSSHVAVGGTLAIHDVFPDPGDGGRAPYEQIYLPALRSGQFEETSVTGSLRILRRIP
ncbi:MAG: 1-O-methyltransferase, partial [Ilumatobacteraceae bacterium]|nr:1-O-methyltransferase [Ilumatobacteraceae bacterium]